MSENKNPLRVYDGGQKKKPSQPKDDKPVMEHIFKDVATWLSRVSPNPVPLFEMYPFKYDLYIINNSTEDRMRFLIKRKTEDGREILCDIVLSKLVALVYAEIKKLFVSGPYLLSMRQVEQAVLSWAATSPSLPRLPRFISQKSFDGLAFTRLSFDFEFDRKDWREVCPAFKDITERMSKPEQFMARLGSIFDESCDRKQAVWISGTKDCGKSQIDWLLRYLAGYDRELVHPGAYISLYTGMLNRWFKSTLINKRIAAFQEADPKFLSTAEFKSVTGDDLHSPEIKYGSNVNTTVKTLFWFFSNQKPEIPNKPELIERIIYCHMKPFTGEMLPEEVYRKKLIKELPVFLGACYEKYLEMTAGRPRIDPGNNDELIKIAEDYDSDIMDVFYEHFKYSENPEHVLEVSYMRRTVENYRLKAYGNRDWSQMLKVWCDNLALTKKRTRVGKEKRPTFITNVRLK